MTAANAPTCSAEQHFPGQTDQVRLARHFVTSVLDPESDAFEVTRLLVSEAVTNALLHSRSGEQGGAVSVRYLLLPGVLRVEISDEGSMRGPQRRVHTLSSMTGRGLELFDLLAQRWGVEGDADGRVVWFEVAVEKGAANGA